MIKDTIIEVAERQFVEGGPDNVSLRKIASKIGYSPTNIYKYFENKDAILDAIVSNRMQQHAQLIMQVDIEGLTKEEALKKSFKAHFEYVLNIPEHYKAVMLSQNERFLKKTAMLNKDTIERLPAQKRLIENIKEGIKNGEFIDTNPVMTAQVIWTSMFGLLIRVIIEECKDSLTINELIDHYFNLLFKGLRKQ